MIFHVMDHVQPSTYLATKHFKKCEKDFIHLVEIYFYSCIGWGVLFVFFLFTYFLFGFGSPFNIDFWCWGMMCLFSFPSLDDLDLHPIGGIDSPRFEKIYRNVISKIETVVFKINQFVISFLLRKLINVLELNFSLELNDHFSKQVQIRAFTSLHFILNVVQESRHFRFSILNYCDYFWIFSFLGFFLFRFLILSEKAWSCRNIQLLFPNFVTILSQIVLLSWTFVVVHFVVRNSLWNGISKQIHDKISRIKYQRTVLVPKLLGRQNQIYWLNLNEIEKQKDLPDIKNAKERGIKESSRKNVFTLLNLNEGSYFVSQNTWKTTKIHLLQWFEIKGITGIVLDFLFPLGYTEQVTEIWDSFGKTGNSFRKTEILFSYLLIEMKKKLSEFEPLDKTKREQIGNKPETKETVAKIGSIEKNMIIFAVSHTKLVSISQRFHEKGIPFEFAFQDLNDYPTVRDRIQLCVSFRPPKNFDKKEKKEKKENKKNNKSKKTKAKTKTKTKVSKKKKGKTRNLEKEPSSDGDIQQNFDYFTESKTTNFTEKPIQARIIGDKMKSGAFGKWEDELNDLDTKIPAEFPQENEDIPTSPRVPESVNENWTFLNLCGFPPYPILLKAFKEALD